MSFDQTIEALKALFSRRKQIQTQDEEGEIFNLSQSHMVLELWIKDNKSPRSVIRFVDLVGFDRKFTQKIM